MQVFSFPVRFFQIQAIFFDFQSGFFKSRQVGKFFFHFQASWQVFSFPDKFFSLPCKFSFKSSQVLSKPVKFFHSQFFFKSRQVCSIPVRFFQIQASFVKSRQVLSNPGKFFFPFPVSFFSKPGKFFFICRQAALPDRRVWTPVRRRTGVLGSGLEPGGALLLDDLCPAQEHRGDPGNSGVPGNRWSRRRRGKRGKTF